ncbi:hypothetical protein QMZ05_19395 [Bradyrhizobium sp. INPA03-11B]|uniref:hypothetical protein n=1 Tax=Bradyrhizobium sp. INPA03-11B TaxID=418598 RepID=UPI0033901002
MSKGALWALVWLTFSMFEIRTCAADSLLRRPTFAPGQEWSIKSSSTTTAKLIIGRIEPWSGRVVVEVTLVDVPIPQHLPGAGGTTIIGHMPFDDVALMESVDRLLAVNVSTASNFESGSRQWREAKGGVFTVSVEKAIEIIFQEIKR